MVGVGIRCSDGLCSTGRAEGITIMSEVKVVVRDNGPFLVSGPITVEDAEGNQFDLGGKETIALCRCGASENRPFCDGTHNRCGFESAERGAS